MDWQIILFALIASIFTSLAGQVWFSRLLFGDVWFQTSGKRHVDNTSLMLTILANLLLDFMTALIFKACIVYADLRTASMIFGFGTLCFIAFCLPVLCLELLGGNRRPRLFAIHMGHRLLVMVILCILASIWM